MELHYDKPFCKIYYDETIPCVYLKWQGFAITHDFREACNFSLSLLESKKISKMIADNTKAQIVQHIDIEWMTREWFPKAYAKGYRCSAVILSEDNFRNLTVHKIVEDMDKEKFTVQYFDNLEDAKNWLKTI